MPGFEVGQSPTIFANSPRTHDCKKIKLVAVMPRHNVDAGKEAE
jgi:hypothetical protein